jgi:hypothetical protein
MARSVGPAVLAFACALAGCGGGGLGNYEDANKRILDGLPHYAGAHVVGTSTTPVETDAGKRIGWVTRENVVLPRRMSDAEPILQYYFGVLDSWDRVEQCCGTTAVSAIYSNGEATASITADDVASGVYEIAVDAHGVATRRDAGV